jgi:hypothetical protein
MQSLLFDFNSNQIQVEIIDDVMWFKASAICKALGYKNTAQAINDNIEPKYTREIRDSHKGGRAPRYISEAGLFQLIVKCEKPEAKEFQTWLYEEALPAIARGESVETEMPFVSFKELNDLYEQIIKGELVADQTRFKPLDTATLQCKNGNKKCQILAVAGSVAEVKLENGVHEFVKVELLSNPIPYVRKPKTKYKTDLFREDLKNLPEVKAIYVEKPSAISA